MLSRDELQKIVVGLLALGLGIGWLFDLSIPIQQLLVKIILAKLGIEGSVTLGKKVKAYLE